MDSCQLAKLATEFENRLGDCYRLSGLYVQKHPNAILIHGSILGPGATKRINHAWVEEDGQSFDAVMQRWFPVAAYDQIFNTIKEKQFGQLDALVNAIKTKHWGPWT